MCRGRSLPCSCNMRTTRSLTYICSTRVQDAARCAYIHRRGLLHHSNTTQWCSCRARRYIWLEVETLLPTAHSRYPSSSLAENNRNYEILDKVRSSASLPRFQKKTTKTCLLWRAAYYFNKLHWSTHESWQQFTPPPSPSHPALLGGQQPAAAGELTH